MIPDDILTALSTFLIGGFGILIAALSYVGARHLFRAVRDRRARLVEPETCGDDGGHPIARHRARIREFRRAADMDAGG